MGSEDLILEAGKSSELSNALHLLAETDVEGEPKFTPSVCREIGKMIVCRTYATPVLELCHLVKAAAELSIEKGRYEYFFWAEGLARSATYHAYCERSFSDDPSDLLRLTKHGVEIHYSDGDFAANYARMPVLAALLEFLLSTLGYECLDDILQNVVAKADSRKSVSAYANDLSRQIYGYLREHLPTAQSQRKFRKILSFCDNNLDHADDDVILRFWQEASLEQGNTADFKTYETVFLTFVRAIQSLEAARDLSSLQHSASIGYDREVGEVNPDVLSETLESVTETESTLLRLSDRPMDQIKFLNKQETAQLETLNAANRLMQRLALSILRNDAFKLQQSRLVQALRRKADASEIKEIIQSRPDQDYTDHQSAFHDLRAHIDRVLAASLHALITAKSEESIGLLFKIAPDVDFSGLKDMFLKTEADEKIVAFPTASSVTSHFLTSLQSQQDLSKEFINLLSSAQTAYQSLSRKGFKERVVDNPDLIDGFKLGAQILIDIAADLDRFTTHLDHMPVPSGSWQSQFISDQQTFQDQFSMIYGGLMS